ncbi:hypothetical protein JTE90_010038 [Oedothorax gibbosus]|uniref:Rho termination factor N-terminal domain-containing protein n=1 Tax=Oedothorax gibbosus TaxID=931172 RepID=A0AAV6V3B3_9ARAC|nr:hypothetical protein JTE90_010038 [Oedothorax gibbosus]
MSQQLNIGHIFAGRRRVGAAPAVSDGSIGQGGGGQGVKKAKKIKANEVPPDDCKYFCPFCKHCDKIKHLLKNGLPQLPLGPEAYYDKLRLKEERQAAVQVEDQREALDNDLINSSASPALYKTPEEHNNPITLTRSSVKKSQKKRKVSFVTPIRRSARLSCLTPQFSSVKDRPKTPIPSRDSSGRKGRVAATSATKMFSGSLFISNSARKLSEERLQRMSYSELRKIARKSGINGKQKAKALIASILESAGSADDSFVALELQIMNSCKENKIKKFEEDRGTPIDTPRRGTYTVDDQADVSMALDNDLINSSASPALYKTPEEHNNPITLTRSSVKKSQKKRKVSFVTPIRRKIPLVARAELLQPQQLKCFLDPCLFQTVQENYLKRCHKDCRCCVPSCPCSKNPSEVPVLQARCICRCHKKKSKSSSPAKTKVTASAATGFDETFNLPGPSSPRRDIYQITRGIMDTHGSFTDVPQKRVRSDQKDRVNTSRSDQVNTSSKAKKRQRAFEGESTHTNSFKKFAPEAVAKSLGDVNFQNTCNGSKVPIALRCLGFKRIPYILEESCGPRRSKRLAKQ